MVAQFLGPLPASNYLVGRAGHAMRFNPPQDNFSIVIHTMRGSVASVDSTYQDASSRESVHYGVGLDGSVVQWVTESDTAYHADNWTVDLTSIGIQHEDDGNDGPRTDALYAASSALVRDICLRYAIPISRTSIIEHKDVAGPGTTCPDSLDVDRIVAMASGVWRAGGVPAAAEPSTAAPAATAEALPVEVTPVAAEPVAVAPAAPDPAASPPTRPGPVAVPPLAPQPVPVTVPPSAAAPTPAPRDQPPRTGDPLHDIATLLYGDLGNKQHIYDAIKGVVNDAPVLIQLERMLNATPAPGAPAGSTTNGPAPDPAAPTAPAAPPAAAAPEPQAAPAQAPPPGPPPPDAKFWGGSAAAVFALQIVYLTILAALAIVYFTNRSLIDLPDSIGPISVAIPWYGALGAVLISLVGVTQHRRNWDPSYRFWHWARPLLGASFGSISVLIFQAGILAVGTTPQTGSANGGTVPKDLLYYLVAFVVGYREETFRELIKRLADVIFTPGMTTVAVSISSLTPTSGPASGGTSVTILGTGLASTDAVRFGVSQATFHVDGDSQLTVTSPAGTAGKTVAVSVTAKSAATTAGSFTYT